MRILVTGCGGDVAQGVAGALRDYFPKASLWGCDTHADHPGQYLFDDVRVVPRATQDGYLDFMAQLLREHEIDILIPTTEPELGAIALDRAVRFDGCLVIHPSPLAVVTGLDKLKTADFLRDNGLPFPWTVPVVDQNPPVTPCILKQRHGHGSKDVFVVDAEGVSYFRDRHPQGIWQELVGDDNCEYTCGVFRGSTGTTRTLSIRRRLVGGLTGSGVVEAVAPIESLLHEIAAALDLSGSINVQLRLIEDCPMVFEINPRFSSTTFFRHLLGFTDVIWCIQDAMGLPVDEYRAPASGTRIYRGSREFVVYP